MSRAGGLVRLAGYVPRWAFDHVRDWLGVGAPRVLEARYLSQHAMALACSHNGGANYVFWGIEGRPGLLDMTTYAGIDDGAAVFVRIEDLSRFNRDVLPRVEHRFVLVTIESDYTVPSDFREACEITARSGRVRRWFATNYDGSAHRDLIVPMPLGMNYRKKHDLHRVATATGTRLMVRERLPVGAQEGVWERIAATAPPVEARRCLAFADFWLNNSSVSRRYGESRADIHDQLRHNPCVVFPPHIVDAEALFSAYAAHAFVISPHGRGLDCFRTWEALFAGCIVIVKRSPLDTLYAGLPVVIVDDWREITAPNLTAWVRAFGSDFNRDRLRETLLMSHWLHRLHEAGGRATP